MIKYLKPVLFSGAIFLFLFIFFYLGEWIFLEWSYTWEEGSQVSRIKVKEQENQSKLKKQRSKFSEFKPYKEEIPAKKKTDHNVKKNKPEKEKSKKRKKEKYKKKYLFSLDLSFQKDLKKDLLSERMFKKFEEHNLKLGVIHWEKEKNKRWIILGPSDFYLIEKTKGGLRVYKRIYIPGKVTIYGYIGDKAYTDPAEYKRVSDEMEKRSNPRLYRWKKDPERAFLDLENGIEYKDTSYGTWPDTLQFIEDHFPERLPELRRRILNKLPIKEWEKQRYLRVLMALYRNKLPLSKKEIQILIKAGYLDNPNDPVPHMLMDPSGNTILKIIDRFDAKYSWNALGELNYRFAWRIPELRKILDRHREAFQMGYDKTISYNKKINNLFFYRLILQFLRREGLPCKGYEKEYYQTSPKSDYFKTYGNKEKFAEIRKELVNYWRERGYDIPPMK